MKKQILLAAVCACLAFTACSGHSKEGKSDSSSVNQDSTAKIGTDTGTSTDAGTAPAMGARSSAGDTAGGKKDTSNTNPNH
jgi:hypothetical protein